MKRLLSAFLALLLLLSLPSAALAEEADDGPVELRTAEDFLRFAESCAVEGYSAGRSFVLLEDIDLSGAAYEPVPFFAGSFQGGGHTIRGLHLQGEGSRQGLFRCTGEGALICELKVRGSVTPGGSKAAVGGIVGENAGTLSACSFEGTVAGTENVGGLVGCNTATGLLSECRFSGEVRGEHQTGGIAGRNEGTVYRCANSGSVNTAPVSAPGKSRFDLSVLGSVGSAYFDISSLREDDFLNITNIGGLVGENLGTVLDSENFGAVGYKLTGYNVGGVAGKSSGFLGGCMNNADVTGRRDVGGIAGQLIPWSLWDLSDGKLDALSAEMEALQNALDQASADAQYMSDEIRTELGAMNGYTEDAVRALRNLAASTAEATERSVRDSIQFDPETGIPSIDPVAPVLPDSSALSAALMNLQGESVMLGRLADSGIGQTAEDLRNVTDQMSRVMRTLDDTVDGLKGSSLGERCDLSESEPYAHDTGAIAGCGNYAAVNAENHGGGIVGTSAFELEFDMEDRLKVSDFLLSNAREYLFAAVRDCGSYGAVRVKEEGAGLIAGTVDVGVVVNCVGLGEASSQTGECVGGIAGSSRGGVLGCWSRADLSGGRYVGGVVGHGTNVSACRSWAHIADSGEYLGAVAGWAEGTVSGNLYVPGAPAGVDGVARTGQCIPVSAEELLSMEDVPGGFELLSVSFYDEDGLLERVEVPFGGGVETLPEVPKRGEAIWKWDDFDASHIYFSQEIHGSYYVPNSALSTGEEVPRFLAEGVFTEDQRLSAEVYTGPLAEEGAAEAWTVRVSGWEGELRLHMRAPEEGSSVFRIGEDGALEALDAERDGSYLVFSLENGGSVALRREGAENIERRYAIAAVVGGVLLLALEILLLSRKGKRKRKDGAASVKTE